MDVLRFLLTQLIRLVFPPKSHEALVEKATLEQLSQLVSPRIVSVDSSHITALLPYRHSLVRALITELKFKDSERARVLLAQVLHDYLEGLVEDESGFETNSYVLLPIPLSALRERERGYNQVERLFEKQNRLPVPIKYGVLERVRDTKPQTRLNRAERLVNMEGAFRANGPLDAHVTYILIDDVVTTGATLRAAEQALRDTGAKDVHLLALSY